jgi:endonuclease/exonuclease/phosphatase family metal-dependent hydrolase
VLRVGLFINVLTCIPLLLAMLAWYIPPSWWVLPPLCAVATKQLLLIPVVWAVFWAFVSFRFLVFNLAFLILNYTNISATFQYHTPRFRSNKDIKVISINVDAFEYKSQKLYKTIAYLKEKDPDVICMQEFRDHLDQGDVRSIAYIKKELGLKNYAFIELMPTKNFGLAIFSKFPILDGGNITEVGSEVTNGVMYADIKMFGRTVRFYNLHLESYNFERHIPKLYKKSKKRAKAKKNLRTTEQSLVALPVAHTSIDTRSSARPKAITTQEPALPQPKTFRDRLTGIWDRLRVMAMIWPRQEEQVAAYRRHQERCVFPIITCGDLNNPPYNYLYKEVKGKLQDCFMVRGNGTGTTKTDFSFDFRIDYVFSDTRLQVIDFKTLPTNQPPFDITGHAALYARLRFVQ